MNRVCIVLDKDGFFDGVAADQEIEFFVVAPHVPSDRVYLYGAGKYGPEHVRELIGGYAVGHLNDGSLGIGEESKLKPSRPALKVVGSEE